MSVRREREIFFTKSSCKSSFSFNCQLITFRHVSPSQHFTEKEIITVARREEGTEVSIFIANC